MIFFLLLKKKCNFNALKIKLFTSISSSKNVLLMYVLLMYCIKCLNSRFFFHYSLITSKNALNVVLRYLKKIKGVKKENTHAQLILELKKLKQKKYIYIVYFPLRDIKNL